MAHFNLYPHNSAVLVIDMQSAFIKAIPSIAPEGTCSQTCEKLVQTAAMLSMPIVFSEQYPKGLGSTTDHLLRAASATSVQIFEKNHFSCSDDQALCQHLANLNRETLIICGIEAHVCVLSTCGDLIQRGYNIVVVADAIDSRRAENRELAIAALRNLGGLVLPFESVILRLQRQSGDAQFKAISKLIR